MVKAGFDSNPTDAQINSLMANVDVGVKQLAYLTSMMVPSYRLQFFQEINQSTWKKLRDFDIQQLPPALQNAEPEVDQQPTASRQQPVRRGSANAARRGRSRIWCSNCQMESHSTAQCTCRKVSYYLLNSIKSNIILWQVRILIIEPGQGHPETFHS